MADKIIQRISLEGAEDVQAKLRKTGEIGAKALGDVNRNIADSNSGISDFGDFFAGVTGKSEESRKAIESVKKALETIKPAAENAGLELGALGEFGKIGKAGGIAGLVAAIGGTLVAALEKAGDTARDQAQRLGSFSGSAEKGIKAYNALKKTAGSLEVPTSNLVDPFEQLLRANQKSGAGLGGDELQDVLKTLFEGASADRVPLEKGQPGITALLSSLREQGQLTPEAAKAAQDLFPTLMQRLVEDLQKNFPKQVAPFSTQQVFGSLQNIGPQIGADLAASKAAFPPGIEDSLNKLKASGERLGNALDNTTIVSKVLDKAAATIDATAEGLNKFGAPIGKLAASVAEGSPIGLAAKLASLGGSVVSAGVSSAVNAVSGGEKPEGEGAIETPAQKVGGAFEALEPKIRGAQQLFDEFNKKGAAQLDVIGSKLTTEQAGIDYKFKPQETDIKLGRDKLAVDQAAIAKQSAQIGVQEAAKNNELANLAPEQAESASRNADSRYSKALKNLRDLEGFDTSAIQQRTPIQDALNELKDADTARKVADVNRKYAYLEPQKAELAQQKAETDIRSADYLQQDTKLTFAKDEAGRTLSTDVAGLRYAQAQLDTQNKIQHDGDVSVQLLGEILQTLEKQGAEKSASSGSASSRARATEPTSGSGAGRAETGTGINGGSPIGAPAQESYVGQNALREAEKNSGVRNATAGDLSPIGPPAPSITKEGFRADQDQSIEDLKADWKSQRELNAQLHNGSFESRTVGTQASPQARTPAGVSQVYPPPVRGHYDEAGSFVPDVPINRAFGSGASIPATNDYEFGGRKNPAGPYQEGISAPVTFPTTTSNSYKLCLQSIRMACLFLSRGRRRPTSKARCLTRKSSLACRAHLTISSIRFPRSCKPKVMLTIRRPLLQRRASNKPRHRIAVVILRAPPMRQPARSRNLPPHSPPSRTRRSPPTRQAVDRSAARGQRRPTPFPRCFLTRNSWSMPRMRKETSGCYTRSTAGSKFTSSISRSVVLLGSWAASGIFRLPDLDRSAAAQARGKHFTL
ncbi:hypothetical protein CK489_28800 [Bradyrhizobium sp. UFLA03-84]|uniref:hypothetical protein n=1 Tax=Bradyrhizobium sp. UFLA03-84 TaxID=418599 RepID=UPI000BAE624B|nr:hypothetical protein [Bradyrhizobium sp. UFLA03-84]PAY05392.1 hypothetical protein CK489_28800 [Bradyrhizobium sp. UFLA03-84]